LGRLDLEEFGAIVVNHTFGFPFDTASLKKRYKGVVIENAAHAWGAQWNEKQVGMDGDAGLFSMYKQMGNFNGGWLWSRDEQLQKKHSVLKINSFWWTEKLQLLWRWQGVHQALLRQWRKQKSLPEAIVHSQMGWNIQKVHPLVQALFAVQWKGLEERVKKRTQVAQKILDGLSNEWIPQQSLEKNTATSKGRPSTFNLTLRLKQPDPFKRDAVVLALRRQGIFVDRLWHNAVVVEPDYQAYVKGTCETARSLAQSVINVPLSEDYDSNAIHHLVSQLNQEVNS
jgi:dTDP-4-amino-4,6-dideoxygalactose transaminase